MKLKSLLLFSVFLFSIVLSSCGGGKQTKSTNKKVKNRGTATGYATIYDGDIALARDRASDDAKIKLVTKILGETLSGTSVMKNFELVSSIVEAKSAGLVKDTRIIKNWKEGNMYNVTIEGTVEPSAVEDAIQSILDTYGRPKFIVLINEKFEGKRKRPGFTETEMIIQEIMGDSGFEFVDAQMIQELMRREKKKMRNAVKGRVDAGAQELLLNDAGAEVLIVGTATTAAQGKKIMKRYGNMKSRLANIKLKAIDLYTGRTLAIMSRQSAGIHIQNDGASRDAIKKTLWKILGRVREGKFKAGKFINTITNKFVKAATQREINIFITGLDYNGLKKFRNDVSHRVRGVKKVLAKGQIKKAAKLVVYFAGKTTDFSDELMSKADKFGFSIEIKESYPNKLVIKAKLEK